MEDDTLKMTVN